MIYNRLLRCLPLLLILLLPVSVWAGEAVLPEGTECLEAGAFQDCTELRTFLAGEGLLKIGDEAFRGCTGLQELTLPASLQSIGENVLSGCGAALWVHCPPGSPALAWARSILLDYDAATVYRAMIVGQTYTGTSDALLGPANDVRAMRFCLGQQSRTPWSCSAFTNLSGQRLLSAISSVFSSATENDVSLLYYSGHGLEDGSLVGSDGTAISPWQLRQQMDMIPGRKVIIADACYSGNLIEDAALAPRGQSLGFSDSFLRAFAFTSRAAFSGGEYFVICSAGPRENAEEGNIQSGNTARIMGYFTNALCMGLGWDGITSRVCAPAADRDADGAVSIREAAEYAITNMRNTGQHGGYSPEDCAWFSPFRR